jgi:Cu(I)/Ag(I) efflux system protein CusF
MRLYMKLINTFAAAMLLGMHLQAAHAQEIKTGSAESSVLASSISEAAEGEVIKIDKSVAKITLRHGPIKNLDMPGMSMVFKIRDVAMLDKLAIGDKVRFRAEKINGAIYVTEIQTMQ